MAFYQTLSEKELQIAPVGSYYVAGEDGAPIEDVKSLYDAMSDSWSSDTKARLMARIREAGTAVPVAVEGVIARADGLEIIKAWVPASLADAVDTPAVVDTPVIALTSDTQNEQPVALPLACPKCGAALINPVFDGLTVCPQCGRTVVIRDGVPTLATSADTLALSAERIVALKQLRPRR